MSGRRALLLGVASSAVLAACGKSRVRPAPLVAYENVDAAFADATWQRRPVLVFFGPSWDCAAKELEYQSFPDRDVAAQLHAHYVFLKVFCDDDEVPSVARNQRRFKVIGTPSLIVMHAALEREVGRVNQYLPPRELAAFLREAYERHQAIV